MTSAPLPATPERLTAILRRAAVLKGDEVVDVAVETARDTLISRIARLRITYSPSAEAGPSHLFFKTEREDVDRTIAEFGRKEVAFYNLVAASTPRDLRPRCYDAVAEPAGRWYLILEDLTASHEPKGGPASREAGDVDRETCLGSPTFSTGSSEGLAPFRILST
jgi:hypothetical protein